jgi:hypothetical protein
MHKFTVETPGLKITIEAQNPAVFARERSKICDPMWGEGLSPSRTEQTAIVSDFTKLLSDSKPIPSLEKAVKSGLRYDQILEEEIAQRSSLYLALLKADRANQRLQIAHDFSISLGRVNSLRSQLRTTNFPPKIKEADKDSIYNYILDGFTPGQMIETGHARNSVIAMCAAYNARAAYSKFLGVKTIPIKTN